MTAMKDKLRRAVSYVDAAIERYKPVATFALFSGGHDSLSATYVAMQSKRVDAVAHINTGIGVEQTREFVRATCKRYGWPLKEYYAKDLGQDYEELVVKWGFPGPGHHGKMYNRLKERCIRQLVREHKKKYSREKVMLISGCRQQESTRRMRHTEREQVDGSRIWVAPIYDWSKHDTSDLIAQYGLPRNTVVDLIHKSGECLCGAFAKPGELEELRAWFPGTARYIDELEKRVKAAGHSWGWEQKPPKKCNKGHQSKQLEFLCMSCPNNEERARAGREDANSDSQN